MESAWKDKKQLASLGEEIAALSAEIDVATAKLLRLIREFDDRGGWHGFESCAHWLSWRIGLGLAAAREKVRVARALTDLPRTSEAFEQGAVSYSKVRAITRVASPDTEQDLLAVARSATAQHVEEVVRGYRKADRARENDRARRQFEDRRVANWMDEDGMVVIHARLPPEAGAIVLKAIEAALQSIRENEGTTSAPDMAATQDMSAPTPDPAGPDVAAPRATTIAAQRRADALKLLAETALASGFRRGGGAERTMVVLHVDAAVLRDPDRAGRSQLEGQAIAPDVARRLACDASIIEVTRGSDETVLDVGRRTRSLPTRIRRALEVRDKGCRFPGCTRTRYLEGHHVKHWADGGETRLDNLLQLCWYHHRAVHEGSFTVTRAAGGFAFRDESGAIVPSVPPSSSGNGQLEMSEGMDARRADVDGVVSGGVAAR